MGTFSPQISVLAGPLPPAWPMNASPPGLLPVHGASCRCPERERHAGAGESPGFIALMLAAAVAGLLAAVPVTLIVCDVLRSGRDRFARGLCAAPRPGGRCRLAGPRAPCGFGPGSSATPLRPVLVIGYGSSDDV